MRASHQRYLRNIDTAAAPYYLSEYMKFLIPHYGKQYLPKTYEYIQDDSTDDLSSLIDYDDPDQNMDDQYSSVSGTTDDNITYKSDETIIPAKRKTITEIINDNFPDDASALMLPPCSYRQTEVIDDNFPDDGSALMLPPCKKVKPGTYSISSSMTSDATVIDNGDLMFLKSLLPDLALLDRTRKINFRISVLNLVRELVNSM